MAGAQATRPRRRWTRDETETRVLRVLKWVSIAFFVFIIGGLFAVLRATGSLDAAMAALEEP